MSPVKTERFGGFDKSAMGFWVELSAEMNRDWRRAAARSGDAAERRGDG